MLIRVSPFFLTVPAFDLLLTTRRQVHRRIQSRLNPQAHSACFFLMLSETVFELYTAPLRLCPSGTGPRTRCDPRNTPRTARLILFGVDHRKVIETFLQAQFSRAQQRSRRDVSQQRGFTRRLARSAPSIQRAGRSRRSSLLSCEETARGPCAPPRPAQCRATGPSAAAPRAIRRRP